MTESAGLDVATIWRRHGLFVVVLQPLAVLVNMVVGLKVIFCSVPDCSAVTVALIVNRFPPRERRKNLELFLGVVRPRVSTPGGVPAPAVTIVAPGAEQDGMQNLTSK